ncbi:unnamed protein product [Ascophyllum nodosum]
MMVLTKLQQDPKRQKKRAELKKTSKGKSVAFEDTWSRTAMNEVEQMTAVLKEVEAMACEDIRPRTVENEEEEMAAVLKEMEAMACEDIRSRAIKNKEETMGVVIKETEIIAVEDVRTRILMTVASAADVAEVESIGTALRGAEATTSKGDRPQMMWKVEESTLAEVVTSNVVDATSPQEAEDLFKSVMTTHLGLAGQPTLEAHR